MGKTGQGVPFIACWKIGEISDRCSASIGPILGTEKSKDGRTPTGSGNRYWGPAESALAESLSCAHCRPPVRGGFKERRNERLSLLGMSLQP